jgi:hemolysin III
MERTKFRLKEPFCSVSHSVGAALSVVALVVLMVVSWGRPWHMTAFAIYGGSLILLYTASALYHTFDAHPRIVSRLQRFDHVAIFCLIAGTYTPVCLLGFKGPRGWILLCVEWGLALIGIYTRLFLKKHKDWLRLVLYLCMGWLVVPFLQPLSLTLAPAAIGWLVAGGLTYTAGCVIFAIDRPHLCPGKFSAHDLWHCFVLGGSVCHFILMLCFVARMEL